MLDLSVIICTYNQSARLKSTLEAIRQCDIPAGLNWELVLVNNNSSDSTDSIIDEFNAKLPIVKILETTQGLSVARNAGIEVSSGKLLVFTDDDVTPDKSWIAAYWEAFRDKPEKFYFGGPITSEFVGEPPDKSLLELTNIPFSIRGLDWGDEAKVLNETQCFIGPNWACPRKAMDAIGRFDTALGLQPGGRRVQSGEETAAMRLLRAQGLQPWYIPEARLVHHVPSHKTGLKHLATRMESCSFTDGGQAHLVKCKHELAIFDFPISLIKRVVKTYIKYCLKRCSGADSTAEYLAYRRAVGVISGTRYYRRLGHDS